MYTSERERERERELDKLRDLTTYFTAKMSVKLRDGGRGSNKCDKQ